jgi:hypothetical protein
MADDWGDETSVALPWGGELRAPAYPVDCDYVRILDAQGEEIAYWNFEEWRQEPELVMGAIVGAMKGGRPDA